LQPDGQTLAGAVASSRVRFRKLRGQAAPLTLRRKVTHGDIEHRVAEHSPTGYNFVDSNWEKWNTKFVGQLVD
jgi:hypothetical protein